jgi:hypothetical protein
VQARVRRRVLHWFATRGYLDKDNAKEMAQWANGGGFSLDASVRIEGHDRAGLERLLRYCARPPFALERLEALNEQRLIYRFPKPRPDGSASLTLAPLELIQRLAALIPRPRAHRHRYHGVLAPNAALRAAVTALAPAACDGKAAIPEKKTEEPAVDALWRSPARYLCSSLPWDSPPSLGAGAKIRSRRIFGRCCWPASTSPCRWSARSARPTCGSWPL